MRTPKTERKRTWDDNALKIAVEKNQSLSGVIKELGLGLTGGNFRSIKIHISRLGLSTSHFKGQGHLKGKTHNYRPKTNLSEILVENSSFGSSHLRKRLINEQILPYNCDECGIDTWNNKPITLELDHINGTSTDNRLENLRLLCPNCHSQTETFSRGNVKIIRKFLKPKCQGCDKELKNSRSKKCLKCYHSSK